MSAKSDFIRAVVEEGITMARKYFGTGVETQIKKSTGGQKKLDKAKAKFKQNKVDATKKKKSDAAKAKTKREKSKATEKGLRLSKNYEVQEGMGLDAITGRDIRAAVDVDKGKAGKVTRSPEPGFLQQQRSEGSRARAARKVEAETKARGGDKQAAKTVKRMEDKDKLDTARATAKGAASRVKPDSKRGRAAAAPELKSLPKKEAPAKGAPINLKTGEINEAVFNKLTPPQQQAAIRNAVARAEGPVARRIKAQLEEVMLKYGRGKAGETGVGARRGGPKGMRGATERNIKDIDEGVGGRGGLDFRKGGKVTKKAIGAHDYRMNKGGLLLSSVDNRKKK